MFSNQKRLLAAIVLLAFLPLSFLSAKKINENPTGVTYDPAPISLETEVPASLKEIVGEPPRPTQAPRVEQETAVPQAVFEEKPITPEIYYSAIVEPEAVLAPEEPIPAQKVIQFVEDATEEQRQAYIASIQGTVVESIDSLDVVVVSISEETAGDALPETELVVQSEPDYYVSALEDGLPVNDPRYTEQWALPAIGAPAAWAEMPAGAPQVTVAVIDSGICADHPDLRGRVSDGWDFLDGDGVPQDDYGHGCSVSGIIAANMNDGIGVAGVAPNAQIMPLRVLNGSGVGAYSDVASAIVYAADHGAQIINMSLGGANSSGVLEDAVRYAAEKGVILVAAAGNSGTEGSLYPAAYPEVIAVGSVDPNLQYSSFSNYGPQVDIWAPGRDILTTKRDGGYGLASGTSFAAPYVAGAEAVVISEGCFLEVNGNLRFLCQSPHIVPSPTITPSNEEPVVDQTQQPPMSQLVVNMSGKVVAWSLDTGEYHYLGEISSSEMRYPVSDYDIFDLAQSPILDMPDKYGFYHGVWSANNDRFAYLAVESLTVNQILKIWSKNGTSQEVVNLLDEASVEYLDPVAWKDDTTIILLGRKLLGVLDGTFSIYEKNINDSENPVLIREFNIPFLSGRNFQLDPQSVFLGIEANKNVAYTLDLRDYSLNATTLQFAQGFEEPEMGVSINILGYVNEDRLMEFYETTASTVTASGPTNSANRPAPFIYWPLDEYWRTRTTTGGEVLQYPDASPWRINRGGSTYPDHLGTDIALSVGTPLYAAGSGTGRVAILYMGCPNLAPNVNNFDKHVTTCINEPRYGSKLGYMNSGNVVILEYTVTVAGQAKTIYLLYGHLKQESQPLGIYQGATVTRGAHIAGSGHNGVSSLPHLHFDVRYSLSDYYDWDDPWGDVDAPHLEPDPGTMWVYQTSPTTKILAAYPGNDRTGSVGGIVRNASGQPVSGVSVTARSGGTSATTDVNGYYTLQNVPEGNTVIVARHNTGDGQANGNVLAYASVQVNLTLAPVCLASDDPMNPLCYTPPTTDTQPPSGSWSSPSNGQTISSRSLTLSANASDNSGGSGVKEVRWSAKWGGNWYGIGSDSSAPYSISWDMCNSGVPNGDVELGMEVHDNAGNVWIYSQHYSNIHINKNYSCTQTGNDTTPPTASWISPGNGQSVNSNTVTLSANASDNSGGSGVREVRWSAKWNNQWSGIGNDSSAPYTMDWNMCSSGVPRGAVELGMEVWDNAGNVWIYSQHYTNISINMNYTCGSGDGGGDPVAGGPWETEAWINQYLAGLVNWRGTFTWSNGYPFIYFDWGTGAPFGWGGDDFSMRLWRNVYFPGGSYEFRAFHDDGVRVWVDGNLVIDNWWDSRGEAGGGRDISTGYHEVKVEYYEHTGDAALQVWWWGPGYPRPDNEAPDGRITSPVNQSASNANTVSISADAWDDASGVDRVEFQAYYCTVTCDTYYLGSDDTSPYTFNWYWGTLPDTRVWLRIDVYDKTGKSRMIAGDYVVIDRDRVAPSVSINTPAANSYLTSNSVTVQVSASDDRSGVQKVQFFAGYDETTGAGAQEIHEPPTPSLSSEASAAEVSSQDYWHEIGWDTNGGDGWSYSWNPSVVPDQGGASFFVYAYDKAGNYQSGQVWPIVIDRMAPTSNVSGLQANTNSTVIRIDWFGNDATSGLESYDIQVQDNGGAWGAWLTGTTSTSANYTGQIGHTYGFRSQARDRAGNVEGFPDVPDAETTVVTVPPNDDIHSVKVIGSMPYSDTMDTRGATTAGSDPIVGCGPGKNSNSIWYRFTAPATGLVGVDTWGSTYDTVLAVWAGTPGSLSLVQCGDDWSSYLISSLPNVPVTEGTTYYIEVMDYGNPGGGTLELFVDFARTPNNDDFSRPSATGSKVFDAVQDVRGATIAADDPSMPLCNRYPGMNSVWYSFRASFPGDLAINTIGSNYDTMVAVWYGERGALTMVGCNDDIGSVEGGYDVDSTLTVPLAGGTTYFIEVSHYNGSLPSSSASLDASQLKPGEIANPDQFQAWKTSVDTGEAFLVESQGGPEDEISAQLWGGTLVYHQEFHPLQPYYEYFTPLIKKLP